MSNRYSRSFTVLAVLAFLASCATHPQSVTAVKRCNAPVEGGGKCPYLQLTPLSTVWTGFDNPNQTYSNLYTRVIINSLATRAAGSTGDARSDLSGSRGQSTADGSEQVYDYRDRGPFLRTFWGIHNSLNLTAYVSVGTFQATVPLVTIDHTSNHSDGEKFVHIVAHTAQNFPLLLLKGDGSNAMATVHFVVKGTDTTQSSAAAAAIEAAQGVATVLAPESAVLTTLSSQSTKDKATALDKAINSVLSRQLDEEQWLDNDVRRWARGAKVTFFIPPSGNESAWSDSQNFQTVGSWMVKFESPRPSVFSDIQICVDDKGGNYCRNSVREAADLAQQEAATRPQQVLNFSLLSGGQSLGTVAAYLKQQSWWDTSMKTFNALKDNEAPKKASVTEFCRSIKQSVVAVGLNTIDAGIVIAAIRDGLTLPATVTAAMKSTDSGEDCQYAKVVD